MINQQNGRLDGRIVVVLERQQMKRWRASSSSNSNNRRSLNIFSSVVVWKYGNMTSDGTGRHIIINGKLITAGWWEVDEDVVVKGCVQCTSSCSAKRKWDDTEKLIESRLGDILESLIILCSRRCSCCCCARDFAIPFVFFPLSYYFIYFHLLFLLSSPFYLFLDDCCAQFLPFRQTYSRFDLCAATLASSKPHS